MYSTDWRGHDAGAQHPNRRAVLVAVLALVSGLVAVGGPASAEQVTYLTSEDFRYGTYIIDQPGTYVLAEDVPFNPNSPVTLTRALRTGELDLAVAAAIGMPLPPEQVDGYSAGFPLFTQFAPGGVDAFTPGGPMDARYDPAAFGIGFFAAIAISADDVVLDLNGHTLQQSREHALLQRFYANVELADQPFLPTQGPHDFGSDIDPAVNVLIRNGTLGLSSHHGIHGNLSEAITIENVDFQSYEVGAVALNGVTNLSINDARATNRKDVPVLGTFSSAQFIKPYIEHLVRSGSTTELNVAGESLDATAMREALRTSINAVHHDVIVDRNIVDGRAQIDPVAHPDEYALFNNPFGLVDGNSYSFLVNHVGLAVDGFPFQPDGVTKFASQGVELTDVHVAEQWAFVNEIPALNQGGKAAIDPVGAVFQVRNVHPDTGDPITVSSTDDAVATYSGNVVANAQALVAKAAWAGEFDTSPLDVSRISITTAILAWVEGEHGYETLQDLNPNADSRFFCNGDSMFHVNKGVIAFKMDGAFDVRLDDTSATGIRNFGAEGVDACGDYTGAFSHPAATLTGYGGAMVRAYTFAGSRDVALSNSHAGDLYAEFGSAIGIDVLTDSEDVALSGLRVQGVFGGVGEPLSVGPNAVPLAIGFQVGPDATNVSIAGSCARVLVAPGGGYVIDDASGVAILSAICD